MNKESVLEVVCRENFPAQNVSHVTSDAVQKLVNGATQRRNVANDKPVSKSHMTGGARFRGVGSLGLAGKTEARKMLSNNCFAKRLERQTFVDAIQALVADFGKTEARKMLSNDCFAGLRVGSRKILSWRTKRSPRRRDAKQWTRTSKTCSATLKKVSRVRRSTKHSKSCRTISIFHPSGVPENGGPMDEPPAKRHRVYVQRKDPKDTVEC